MTDWDKLKPPPIATAEFDARGMPINAKLIFIGLDLGTEDKSAEYAVKNGEIIWIEEAAPISEKVYNNLKPTHDPYANPDAHIYYECKCGAILDPGTKSFAALNGVASDKGWKIRFGSEGYTPYCVECGKDVE